MSSVSNHQPEVIDALNTQDDGCDHRGRLPVKTRKPVKPVNGCLRIVRPLGEVNDNTAEIAINDKPYYLTRHDSGYRLTGFNQKKMEVTVYDLPLDLSACDCPDGTYRPERQGGCKHRAALSAMRKAGKL
jgi:hypothetical protein